MNHQDIFSRRAFLGTCTALAGISCIKPPMAFAAPFHTSNHAFKMCLNPGSIGVSADQNALLQLAIDHGFQAIISMPDQLASMDRSELADFKARMDEHDISWGSGGIPVQFRQDEDRFQEDLSQLPRMAKALQDAGAERMNTWIMPSHATLTYRENFNQHAERLGACARILADHGIRFGLEYVAPKTLLTRENYPFMRTMKEGKELIAEIGTGNVGFVLDMFHWYCANESADDIRTLSADDVITVDLNDARRDLTRDAQIDGTRELPGTTGKVNAKAFLQALIDIGYDGPIRAEPFNQPLREMEDSAAIEATASAIKRTLALVE